jgi:hypothetical protein
LDAVPVNPFGILTDPRAVTFNSVLPAKKVSRIICTALSARMLACIVDRTDETKLLTTILLQSEPRATNSVSLPQIYAIMCARKSAKVRMRALLIEIILFYFVLFVELIAFICEVIMFVNLRGLFRASSAILTKAENMK